MPYCIELNFHAFIGQLGKTEVQFFNRHVFLVLAKGKQVSDGWQVPEVLVFLKSIEVKQYQDVIKDCVFMVKCLVLAKQERVHYQLSLHLQSNLLNLADFIPVV